MYNFCDFKRLNSSNSLIPDGDITGCSGGAINGFNMNDVSPIGTNDIEWVCVITAANPDSFSSANEWTSGLSYQVRLYKGNSYLLKYSLSETFSNDCDVYFIFVNNNGYQIASVERINNISALEFTHSVVATSDFDKIVIVANNVGGGSFGPRVVESHIYELNDCDYALPLIKGDTVQAYTNFELDDTDIAFADLKIGLYSNGFYLYDIATLNQVVVSGDIYNVYFSWTVPVLPKGNYRFVLYEDTEIIHYLSNVFRYTSNALHTSIIKYRNTKNILGYTYQTASTFYNQFRVDIWKGSPSWPEKSRGYETYEGDFIRTKSDIQKKVEFKLSYASENVMEAFISSLLHDEFYIDDIEFKKSDGDSLSLEWSQEDLQIGTGTINLQEVSYSKSIESC